MSLYQSILRPLLFSMDPESAHNMAMNAVKNGLIGGSPTHFPNLEREFFRVKFPNPVGLAAGFDKNGEALNQWKNLGFGFIEIGTITRHAQPGNDKPRMFRIPEEKAIINRMGFNNHGAEAAAKTFEKASPGIPVGINLGKSKITPIDEAAEDYAFSFGLLKDFGDYFVVNVSSPNTPGLRTLQDRPALTKILWRLREMDHDKPLFVKIAPDLSPEQIQDVAETAMDMNLTGIIATNTTITRPIKNDPHQDGGLSGQPVKSLADDALARLKDAVGDKMILMGVGGIMNSADAVDKFKLGASLVQVYTGWVYGGPNFVRDMVSELAALPELPWPSSPQS